MKIRSNCWVWAIALSFCAGLSVKTEAQNVYWDGSDSGSWNLGANWNTSTVPGSGETAIFNASGTITNPLATLDGSQSVAGIIFDSNATGAITLGAGTGTNTLTIGGGGISVNSGSGAHVFNNGFTVNLGADQTWSFNSGSNIFTMKSLLDGSGLLTKNGVNSLILNTDALTTGNTFSGGLRITQANVQVESPANPGANGNILRNPLGTGVIELAGGTLQVRYDGDNATTNRKYTFGNALNVTANSSINFDRRTSTGGQNKASLFSSLSIDSGKMLSMSQGSNGYRLGITGQISFHDDAAISGGDLINYNGGSIVATGTINKLGGNTLSILAANTYSGGTVVNGGGILRVGSGSGVDSADNNDNATAGTGPIMVNGGNRVALSKATNIAAGQSIDLVGNVNSYAVLETNNNFIPTANIRSMGAGTFQVGGGAGFTQTFDPNRLGNGAWRFSSSQTFGDPSINTGAVLLPGAGNIYRVGGGSGTLNVNAVNFFTGSAGLDVGSPLINGTTPAGTSSVLITNTQSFTGETVVNRASALRIRRGGTSGSSLGTTSGIDLFGTLTAESSGTSHGTVFNSAGAVIPVNIFGGSRIYIDNNGVTTAGSNIDRWDNATGMSLNQTDLELRSRNVAPVSPATDITLEQIGAVTFSGGNIVRLTNGNAAAGNIAQFTFDSLTQVDGGTIELVPSSASGLGGAGRLVMNTDAPTPTNGMTTPYIINHPAKSHVTYGANGFANVTYSGTAALNDGTELLNTAALALTGNLDVHAFKQTGAITTGAGTTVRVRSGGLIADFTGTSGTPVSVTNTANLNFTDVAAVEGNIFVDDNDTLVQSGTLTAGGFNKMGAGGLTLTADNSATLTSGTVRLNRGTMQLEHAAAAGNRPISLANSTTLNLRQSAATTFNNALTVSANTPFATINVARISTNSSADNVTFTVPSLTLAGLTGNPIGQTLNFSGSNNFDLAVSGMTTVTGNVTFHSNSSGSDLFLDGGLTSNTAGAVITKSGSTLVRIAGNNTVGANTQVQINGGTLELRNSSLTNAAATPLGAGGANGTTIFLNTGTLAMKGVLSNTSQTDITMGGTSATAGGYNVFVNGDSTITVDRYSGSAGDRRIRIGNLTIGGHSLSIQGGGVGNNWYLGVNGPTTLNGDAVINTGAPVPEFFGKVAGGRIIKQGSATLRFSAADNINTFDGGMIVQQGWVQGYNARSLGTGNLQVLPGGGVTVNKSTTLQAGQQAVLRSSAFGLPMVGSTGGTVLAPSALLPNLDLSGAASGIFAAGGGNYNTSLDLGDLFGAAVSGDDDWYLGAVAYSDTVYTANALTAGAGNTWRIGGGGGNLRLNRNNKVTNSNGALPTAPADLALSTNLLTGNSSLTLGMPAHNLCNNSTSTLLIASTNDYTGGTVIHRGMTLQMVSPAGATGSGAGTGGIDVYGTLVLRNNGTITDGAGGNVNAITARPGSRILLNNDDTSSGFGTSLTVQDRWGNSADVTLDGTRFDLAARNAAETVNETIGNVTFGRGSSLRAARNTGNGSSRAYLTIAGLTRTNFGTLGLVQQDSKLPDQAIPDGLERIIISGTAPTITNGMVAPYIIDTSDHRFVTYNSTIVNGSPIGFQQVDFDDSNINTATETERVGLSAGATLTTNPVMHALKSTSGISASGSFNTVTVRSGGFIAGGGTHTANFVFQDSDSNNVEALIYASADTTVQGTVTASQITKFGGSELRLDRASGVFDGPVVINDGAVRLVQLKSLSATSNINLQGGGTAAGHDTHGPGLYFGASIASGAEQVYTHGTITSVDNNRIYFLMGGNDRTQRIGNLVMDTTAGNNLSVVQFRLENSRNFARMGSITFNSSDAILNVINNTFQAGGATSSLAPSALVGNNKNVTKFGVGMLQLGGLSSTLTNSTLTIAQGALRVTDNAALGNNNAVVIDTGAALEIATSNFALAGGTLTQNWGSGERWSVQDARGNGDYSVPAGVNLQINTNIAPASPRTITLNGGSIEGFLYTDANAKMVYRMLNSNVTLNLGTHSYIGQNLYVGANGSDAGMQGSFPNRNPLAGDARGAVLVVNGPINGAESDLTKIGRDMVVIAGSEKTYRNTIVEQGILRIGSNNALPNSGILTTKFDATFDLNGYNQTVGNIGTKDGAASPGGVGVGYSGKISNTGYETRTLTAGNADNYTYAGQILATVALTKVGSGALTLTGDNNYLGDTTVNAGKLLVNGNYTGIGEHVVNDTATLGGTGTIASMVTLATGGTLDPGVTTGIITVGGMSLSGTGAGSTINIDITSPGVAGTNYDQVSVTGGTETIAGNLRVQLAYTPGDTSNFTIISNAAGVNRSGFFATLNSQPLIGNQVNIGGIDYTLDYNGGDGNDVVLSIAVPEPSGVVLIGAFALALLGRRRRL